MVWHRVALFQARALLKNERSHRRNADCRHDGVPPPVLRVGKKAACWAPDLYGTGHHAGKVSGAVEEEQKKPNGQGCGGGGQPMHFPTRPHVGRGRERLARSARQTATNNLTNLWERASPRPLRYAPCWPVNVSARKAKAAPHRRPTACARRARSWAWWLLNRCRCAVPNR